MWCISNWSIPHNLSKPSKAGTAKRMYRKIRRESCLGFIFYRKLQNWWRRRQNIEVPDLSGYTRWELDYDLTQYPVHGLFYEYLEMGQNMLL